MKSFLMLLLLCVPIFAQDALSTDDVHRGPRAGNVNTCTIQDLDQTPETFVGYQIIDDCWLGRLDKGTMRGRWEGYLSDMHGSTSIDVVCDEELAKRIAADMKAFRNYGLRWHVIVGDSEFGSGYQVKIVQLELFDKDGYFVRSYS